MVVSCPNVAVVKDAALNVSIHIANEGQSDYQGTIARKWDRLITLTLGD